METKNYGLLKPTQDDFYDVEVFNANMDKIDNELKKRSTAMENVSDSEVEFVAAEVRENIKSGETLRIIFGKLAKLFADLKKVAFTGNYKDLSDKPSMGNAAAYGVANNDTTTEEGFVADARIVKTHGDEIDVINKSLNTLTDSGNIEFFSVGADGSPYITYKAGADSVTKKLGSMVSFGIISLAYKAGTKSFTINTRGKQMLYYAAGLGSHSNISITTGAEKTSVSNDSIYLKSSDFVKKIIGGIPLPHSIDVSSLEEITITCTSYTGNNENCDFIFSFDSASAKLEGDYLLYGV